MAKLKVLHHTPAQLGYSFPAEWHRHAGTWFSWPRPEGISFPGKYHTVPENLARIMCEIQSREQVHVNVPNENWEHIVRRDLMRVAMTSEDIRSELERQPFRALRLHMVSGNAVDVSMPGMAWMLQNALMIFHEPQSRPEADERYDVVSLRNIERIEQLSS